MTWTPGPRVAYSNSDGSGIERARSDEVGDTKTYRDFLLAQGE